MTPPLVETPGAAGFEFGGEYLLLLPERAVWWPAQRALLVADLHLGKAMAFRRLGVAVPSGTTTESLELLTRLVERHAARRVVFLGDFLHHARSRAASTFAALARWRAAHAALQLLLVRGNHDRHAGDPPDALGIEVVEEPWRLGGLALSHHPRPGPGLHVVAGHLHPCITLAGRARDRLRLPCLHLMDGVAVLPAFGAFTGMHPIERREGDRVFVIAGDRAAPLPVRAAGS